MHGARMFVALLNALLLVTACSSPSGEELLYSNTLDDDAKTLTQDGVTVDSEISADGGGSLRIATTEARTIRLAEVQPTDAENVLLVYRAKLRAQDLQGKAYLEMWCVVPGHGQSFSRALENPITGTTEWVSQQTPFVLKSGQKAELVKLNLVVEGRGTVWIDDLELAMTRR